MPMLEMRPRPFHGMLTGTRDEGIMSISFVGSDCTLYSCPIWSIDELLAKPALLSPGVYILLGDPSEQGGKLRAIVGEGGMLQERLQAHANDERLDYVWQILAVVGPRVMNETQRLMIQRRLTDEINHSGRAVVMNAHDADRFVRTEIESAIADRIIEDIRPLICMIIPDLIAEVEPVRLTIGSRAHLLPRGVDAEAETWTDHEMRFKGAYGFARMRGRETVLCPGSMIQTETHSKVRWLKERREQLLASGVLRPMQNPRLLLVVSSIRFETAHEAATFVSGRASVSARLVWIPIMQG